MKPTVTVNLDNHPVRFTPDGKVSVVDAIRAVSNSDRHLSIWEDLKTAHPEILMHCECYSFEGEGPISVVNSEGWEGIWMLLIEYLLNVNLP